LRRKGHFWGYETNDIKIGGEPKVKTGGQFSERKLRKEAGTSLAIPQGERKSVELLWAGREATAFLASLPEGAERRSGKACSSRPFQESKVEAVVAGALACRKKPHPGRSSKAHGGTS